MLTRELIRTFLYELKSRVKLNREGIHICRLNIKLPIRTGITQLSQDAGNLYECVEKQKFPIIQGVKIVSRMHLKNLKLYT